MLEQLATAYFQPYLLYFKIAFALLMVGLVIFAAVYLTNTFAERDRLAQNNSNLTASLAAEQIKYGSLLNQTMQIMETNKKIVEAVQRVKINSSVYIDRVEASRLATPADGGTVLIRGGMLKAETRDATMSLFNGYTTNRASANIAGN